MRSRQCKIGSSEPHVSFAILEEHLRKVNRALKNVSRFQDRRQILNWLLEILTTLGLRNRSIDMCLILVDDFFYAQNYQPDCHTTFCIAAVLFVIKLEGDFTPQLVEFINAIDKVFHIHPNSIFQTEVIILQRLPPNFLLTPTYSDALDAILVNLAPSATPIQSSPALRAYTIKLLIDTQGLVEFDHLIIYPAAVAVYNTLEPKVLQKNLSSDLRDSSLRSKVKPSRLQEFLRRYLI